MKKFAFTVSELLIALAVLGILSVVMTPIISKIVPDQNKVMVKRSYYVLTNTIQKMLDDETLYSPFGAEGTEDETRIIYKGFDNKSAVVYEGEIYSDNSKFRKLFLNAINAKNIEDGDYVLSYKPYNAESISISNSGTKGKTKDGVIWTFVDDSSGDQNIASYLLIDVNGDKKPNCYQGSPEEKCAGRVKDFDQYVVLINTNGAVKLSSDNIWVKNILDASSNVKGD